MNWFAYLMYPEDSDWGTGSFSFDECVQMARAAGAIMIDEVDAGYEDEDGDPTIDPVVVATYYLNDDNEFVPMTDFSDYERVYTRYYGSSECHLPFGVSLF